MMSVRQYCLRRVAIRTLGLIVLQFFVIVILPNNEVGTPELPAVGAASVLCSAGSCSVAPCKGESAAFAMLFGLEGTEYVGQDSLVLSRHGAISAADVLQLSRRLRI
jgi:hypothetical protein